MRGAWDTGAAIAAMLLMAGAIAAALLWRLARRQTGRIAEHPVRGLAERYVADEVTRRTGGDRAPRLLRWGRAAALRAGRGGVGGVVDTARSRVTAPFAIAALALGALAALLVATAPDPLRVGAVALVGGVVLVVLGRSGIRARMRRRRGGAG